MLLIEEREGDDDLDVSLWTGEPEASPGAAVVLGGDGLPVGIARVPVCRCGDQGCADASYQFKTRLPADALNGLVETLEHVPRMAFDPERATIWRD